jgi:hypothetical protein
VADLPAVAPSATPAVGRRRRWNVAAMGGCTRRGRWRPAPPRIAIALMGAFSLMGGVDVKARRAGVS